MEWSSDSETESMAAVRSEPDPEPARPATPQPRAPVTPEALLREPTLPPTAVNVATACLCFCWNVSGLRRRNNSHRLVPGMDGFNEDSCVECFPGGLRLGNCRSYKKERCPL